MIRHFIRCLPQDLQVLTNDISYTCFMLESEGTVIQFVLENPNGLPRYWYMCKGRGAWYKVCVTDEQDLRELLNGASPLGGGIVP